MAELTPEERAEKIATEWHHSGVRVARKQVSVEDIAKAIREAVEAEREACAKLCEEATVTVSVHAYAPYLQIGEPVRKETFRCGALAQMIRARGKS